MGILDDGFIPGRSPRTLKVPQWQPIDTAPKDGTRILGAVGDQVRIFQWNDERFHKRPRPFWASVGGMGKGRDRAYQPTHWMPLPEPPMSTATGS